MASVLHVASGTIGSAVVDALRAEGIRVVQAPPVEEVFTPALDTPATDGPDAALIDADVEAPLNIARRIHDHSPRTHIVFLTPEERESALRKELMVTPRIGRYWSVVRPESLGGAVSGVRLAVQEAERRKKFRTTVARINAQLAAHPAATRKTVVTDRFMASILDQLRDGVITLDVEGRILTANAAARELSGLALQPGERLEDVLPGWQIDYSGGDQLLDVNHRRPDGSRVIVGLVSTVVDDPEQGRLGAALVARDITGRVEEEESRTFLATATAAVSSTLQVSEALQRLAALLVERYADVCAIDLLNGDHFERMAVAVRDPKFNQLVPVLAKYPPSRGQRHPTGQTVNRDGLVICDDASAATWREVAQNEEHLAALRQMGLHSFLTAPIRVGGRLIAAISLGRGALPDGFAPKMQRELEELARRTATALQNAFLYNAAEEANRAKDEFLATVSHELRTPLTSILGWVQMLRIGETDTGMLEEGLEAVEQSARVQAQLVDDLLDLSRMQMGKMHLRMGMVDLGKVARAAADTVRPAAIAKEITIEFDLEPDIYVSGDPNRLQQVVWNLLSNSVKFTDRGGRIVVRVWLASGSKAQLDVCDTGRGIETEFLPYVFERFRQADSTTTRRFGGLGLGLAIVKQIVEMHGGSVSVTSEGPGQGATFSVLLAVAPLWVDGDATEEDAGALAHRLDGVEVLVVEDDRASARAIAGLLRRAGAKALVTHSVIEALEVLGDTLPDVLISDVAMPESDGLALIHEVRAVLRVSPERLPAIVLTAFHDQAMKIRLLGAGFQRFLKKPIDARELITAVEELNRRKR
jgi:signal transduction histidine kinase/PAS domain-containing protein/ActR/RegA family two-component response regulator